MTDAFFKRLCSRANLYMAWRHVRSRARKSQSQEIRDAAQAFDVDAFRSLQSIQMRLVAGSFKFPPADGVLKDKKKREREGKKPRPIVIADIRSRIVQRALLQCLQPEEDDELYPLIGRLREVNNSTINFGGTPYGGVPKALNCALSSIRSGYSIFYKSDIGSFFTKVPHNSIISFLEDELGDKKFVKAFRQGLDVQLRNAEELGEYLDLFPENDFGVAQGSSLSAFAGNVFLRDVDMVFANMPGIVLVRYIDDVLLLGRSNDLLLAAKSRLRKMLKQKGLSLYDPASSPAKAAEGHVRGGLDYLGCNIRIGQLEPSKSTRTKLLKKVDKEIRKAKASILKFKQDSKLARGQEDAFSQCVVNVDNIVRGWANSFRFVNNRLPFVQADREISRRIFEFRAWAMSLEPSAGPSRARMLGLFQTSDVEYKSIEEFCIGTRPPIGQVA